MGIVAAILSFLGAVASTVMSALTWWVRNVHWGVTLGILAVICAVAWGYQKGSGGTGGCSCREIACGCRPRPPRPTRWDSYTVSSVTTGVSIEVKAGLAGKRTRTITLASVACPLSPDLAEQSRANLEALAGKTIRVERHGILQETPDGVEERQIDSGESLSASEEGQPEATAKAPEVQCLFCGGVGSIPGVPNAFDGNPPDTVCRACNGTGQLSSQLFAAAVKHAKHDSGNGLGPLWECQGGGPEKCPICRMGAYEFIIHPEYHPELHDLWAEATAEAPDSPVVPVPDPVASREAEPPEAKSPIVGQVFGESGADLGIEQAKAGMVTVLDGGSKELKAAESFARSNRIGIWKQPE